MFHTIEEFLGDWRAEAEKTKTLFAQLTDDALEQKVWAEGRTLGRLAWHIVSSISEMMSRVGFKFDREMKDTDAVTSAEQIREGYALLTASLDEQIRDQWSDESLKVENDMYGQMWSNAATLNVLIVHQIHHRGQLTVLMRQAGLKVPGIYGPAKEDWSTYGMPVHP